MSKEPTIPAADVERRAREVWGDVLVSIEFKPRVRRSERIRITTVSGTIDMTSDSYSDPDKVRKALLKLLDDCEKNIVTIRSCK